MKEKLYFELVDYEGQIMNRQNSQNIKISAIEPNSSVKGTDFGRIKKGVAEFDNLIFISEDGRKNIKYE